MAVIEEGSLGYFTQANNPSSWFCNVCQDIFKVFVTLLVLPIRIQLKTAKYRWPTKNAISETDRHTRRPNVLENTYGSNSRNHHVDVCQNGVTRHKGQRIKTKQKQKSLLPIQSIHVKRHSVNFLVKKGQGNYAWGANYASVLALSSV